MIPIITAHTNKILSAPENWDENKHGVCAKLPITFHDDVMYSYHKPSWKERLQILFGKPVRLCVASGIHPPVALDIE
jgi:hypothetical protein